MSNQRKCSNCGAMNSFYNSNRKKCKNCGSIIYRNINANKILDLEKKSSILKLIDAKRSGILRLKCKTCTNESPGEIEKNRIVCSYCKSSNVEPVSPIGILNESGRSTKTRDLSGQVIKYKRLTKLKASVVNLNGCLKGGFVSEELNNKILEVIKQLESELSSM